MATLEEITSDIAALQGQVTALDARVDEVVTLVAALRAGTSNPVTPEALGEVRASLAAVSAPVQAALTKLTQVLGL